MKKPYLLFTAIAAAIITFYFSACKKDDNNSTNNNQNTTTYNSPSALFDKYAPKPQKFTIDAAITANLTLQQGTYFNFMQGFTFMDGEGKTVSGKVDLEIIEVYKKSDMIFSHINTSTSPDNMLLESGGMYYLNAKQNGKTVFPEQNMVYSVRVPSANPKNDMLIFDGFGRNADFNNIVWKENEKQDSIINQVRVTPEGYVFNTNKFFWVNVDRYAQRDQLTTVKVKLTDDSFTYDSSVAFIVFEGNSVINLIKENNSNKDLMMVNMPVGFKASILVINIEKNKIYSAIKPITITNNFETTISVKETTEDELIKAIKELD